ncbi:Alcohol acetyltransferase [Vermiconidia calcicola]|uniref:Alcohol acetyltransferase n=1 Tax=Vermiconidia calcicola TaxID=1690605 RepID=A0ACC3NX12_9PEZI|nr:Alcohol acetyltransferase [Vermiconidia calcicola]
MTQSKVIRPLGGLEQYSSSRHSLGFYSCVAGTCRYTLSTRPKDDPNPQHIFQQAVEDIVLALPSLRVGIKDEDSKTPKFVQLEHLDLPYHLEWAEESAHHEQADQEVLLRKLADRHSNAFADLEQRPPWRLTCVRSYSPSVAGPDTGVCTVDAIFAVHHAIADGLSTAVFHSHLLEVLNKRLSSTASSSSTSPDDGTIAFPDELDLPPPVDTILSFKLSWSFFLSTLWNEFGPAWLSGAAPSPPWTGRPITQEPSRVALRALQIPALVLSGVLAACRAHSVSLTPLLHAVILSSLAKRIPENEAQSFIAQTPINLRPSLKIMNAEKLMGTHITGENHLFDKATLGLFRSQADDVGDAEEYIWSTAAAVKAQLQRRLKTIPQDDQLGLLPYVSDWRQRWLKTLGRPRSVTWEISNIGSMPSNSETAGHWHITQAMLTQSANVAGPAFNVNVAGVRERGVTITLSWQESIVEIEIMEGLATDLGEWLRRIAGTEAGGL